MSFFDKIKNVMNIPDEDYYDDDGMEEDYGLSEPLHEAERPQRSRDRDRERDRERPAPSRGSRFQAQDPDKVVNIHTTAQLQVVLVKPERFEDASGIADNLNEKRTVVLNLESANRDVARRLVDFLSGVAYANNGQIKRVANSTFIITPYNVDVMGDLLDELESNGMFF
ncbi:MAG: cell division protein SepF [Clostridiales bacterium]|nr:cell division protein SepF [Clostridiales bacterium]